MPTYVFDRLGKDEKPMSNDNDKWIPMFTIRFTELDEDDMIEVIEEEIDDDHDDTLDFELLKGNEDGLQEPGWWRVMECFPGGVIVHHGPFEVGV